MARLSPRFVVQRHRATTLHYDLRLEIDGVAVSWAVPKEPTLEPGVRRLAVRVDDHDLAHLDYEDAAKQIWDHGTWESTTPGDPAAALAAGHLSFVLHGRRLAGGFTLLHTRLGDDDRNWLLLARG